eukprot:7427522-Pyramimonas_sp.AAC.1
MAWPPTRSRSCRARDKRGVGCARQPHAADHHPGRGWTVHRAARHHSSLSLSLSHGTLWRTR